MSTFHEVDGIIEEDNRLPNWWLYTFYGSVVFALGYWLWFQSFDAADSPLEAYKKHMVAARKAEVAKVMAMGELTDEKIAEMTQNAAVVAEGAAVWRATCVPCHGPSGGGIIGPNLTDEFWLHGGRGTEVARVIRDGVIDKGMLAWGPKLGEVKVRAVTVYVMTLRNSHAPGGKPPQGEKLATIR